MEVRADREVCPFCGMEDEEGVMNTYPKHITEAIFEINTYPYFPGSSATLETITRGALYERLGLEPRDSNSDISAVECEDCGALGPACEAMPMHDSPIGGFNLCPACHGTYKGMS